MCPVSSGMRIEDSRLLLLVRRQDEQETTCGLDGREKEKTRLRCNECDCGTHFITLIHALKLFVLREAASTSPVCEGRDSCLSKYSPSAQALLMKLSLPRKRFPPVCRIYYISPIEREREIDYMDDSFYQRIRLRLRLRHRDINV